MKDNMSKYRDGFREVEREGFWTLPRLVIAVILLLVIGGGLTFVSTGINLANYKFWAPKQREAERQVMRHDQSFVDGMNINLGKQIDEYQTADTVHQIALRQRILDESRQIDNMLLSPDIQSFIVDLKEGRR